MRRRWPGYLGLLALAALVWWGANAIEPDPGQVDAVCFGELSRTLIERDLVAQAGSEGVVRVGALETRWGPACEMASADILARTVAVVPGAPGTLRLECGPSHGKATMVLELERPGEEVLQLQGDITLPDSLSLLVPLLAVLVALLARRVLLALMASILFGALVAERWEVGPALWRTVDNYVWQPATDPFNLYIFGFTLALIGMVHITIAMGGMQGVIDRITRLARSVRSTQIATALMGVAVFFDDYANSVVVGAAARPLTDAQRISREKLAYIVDSTAAPIAGVAIVSTWIGVEIQLFEQQLPYVGEVATSGYDLFFQVLPYRFYCIFAVSLVFIVALTGRDFGGMLAAERRARRTGRVAPKEPRTRLAAKLKQTVPKPDVPARWANGLVPIVAVILGTFVAFMVLGARAIEARGTPFSWFSLADLGAAFTAVGEDNVVVLFWAAVGGSVLAFLLALFQGLLTVRESLLAWLRGARSMLLAILILILASGIRRVTEDVETASYLVALLGDVSPKMLPVTSFLLAAAVAFATGTSWGTMGILLPVAIPLTAALSGGGPDSTLIVLLVAGSVLDGAIFGDHCSLISDTTVMSSMACSCDHVEHVRTQIPYALLAMVAAGGAGYLLMSQDVLPVPVWVAYLLGLGIMWLWVRFRGQRPE